MNTVYVLMVAFFTTGSGDIMDTGKTFEKMSDCSVAAEKVVDSYAGETPSRLSAFCTPIDVKTVL